MADKCCAQNTSSPIWMGKSTGYITTFRGIEIYTTKQRNDKPTEVETRLETTAHDRGKRVILHLTEGHSIYFLNAQLLADSFASHLNCDVIMPDLFAKKERVPKNNTPHFPPGKEHITGKCNEEVTSPPHFWKQSSPEEFEQWKQSVEPEVTDPIIAHVVEYIHATYGEGVKIGGVGYCFGGRYVLRLMGSGVLDVGVVNHPSFFTLDEVSRLGSGKRLAIFAAEIDSIFPTEKRRATEDKLSEKGVGWMSSVFSGTEHGFAVRGDLEVKKVKFAKEKAFTGAVEWLEEWV